MPLKSAVRQRKVSDIIPAPALELADESAQDLGLLFWGPPESFQSHSSDTVPHLAALLGSRRVPSRRSESPAPG